MHRDTPRRVNLRDDRTLRQAFDDIEHTRHNLDRIERHLADSLELAYGPQANTPDVIVPNHTTSDIGNRLGIIATDDSDDPPTRIGTTQQVAAGKALDWLQDTRTQSGRHASALAALYSGPNSTEWRPDTQAQREADARHDPDRHTIAQAAVLRRLRNDTLNVTQLEDGGITPTAGDIITALRLHGLPERWLTKLGKRTARS